MNRYIPLSTLGIALTLLHGCGSRITDEYLSRSVSNAVLPLGPIRLPPADTNLSIQASLAVTGMSGDKLGVVLRQPNGDDSIYRVKTSGNSVLSLSPVQGTAAVNVWFLDHIRFGASVDVSDMGEAYGLEAGLRFGEPVSFEVFAGSGSATSRSIVDWRLTQRIETDLYSFRDTVVDSRVHTPEKSLAYLRGGFHLGARRDGPWIEGVIANQNLFETPGSRTTMYFKTFSATAGWAIYTEYGAATLYARGFRVSDEWTPAAGFQYTVDLRASH